MSFGITEEQNEKIVEFIATNRYCGIIAPTGSGKSTTMIKNIYEKTGEPRIFVSEPTIPSAQGLYTRMTGMMGREKVGYAAEGDVRYGPTTPIVYCTSGHLRRKMLSYFDNGEIKSGAIDFCEVLVLDEAHNGSIDIDAIIEMWIYAINSGATVPHLVLASATLSKENIVIASVPMYEIKTKSLPVKVEYALKDYTPEDRSLHTDLGIAIISKHYEMPVSPDSSSKWLVFCAGKGEVENVCDILRDAQLENVTVLPAYSTLTGDQISKIFEPAELGTRSIIVATNIAEASITIDGLDGVFDSMLEKVGETSASGGLRLVVKNISKSSASQRKGRTGRTKPGFCYRMCTELFYNKLAEQREPEITRVPLTNLAIEFLNVGLDPQELFKDRVSPVRMQETLQNLADLEMIDKLGNVTKIGAFATRFPLAVKNSALIYNWMQMDKGGVEGEKYPAFPMVVLACLIDCFGPSYYFYPRKEEYQNMKEYELFRKEYHKEHFAKYESENDLKSLLKMWNDLFKEIKTLTPDYNSVVSWCKSHSLNNKKIQELIKAIRQCYTTILQMNKTPLIVGTFNEDNFLKVATKILIKSYKRNSYELVKDGIYLDKQTGKYFKIDKRQALNPQLKDNYPKILGIRTAELATGTKFSSNIISLFYPI